MEESSDEQLQQVLMHIRLLLANVENFKYVIANAEYLDKEVITNALNHAVTNMEPTLQSAQMHIELELLLRNPNAG